jgi:phosphate-selective porin
MRHAVTLLAAAALAAGVRPALGQAPSPQWGGYAQVRFTGSRDSLGFTIRRAKLWVGGDVPFAPALQFRVQALFRPTSAGALVLQDAWVGYGARASSIRAGQMVPDFSLERSQADATIPLIERAGPVNTLIPSATTGARDVGAQATLQPGRALWHVSVGLFNGNGGNAVGNEDKRFLVTGRAVWAAKLGGADTVALGGSAAYRKTGGLVFQQILGTTTPFVGEDFRWGAEGRLAGPRWTLQSEYLRARLGSRDAWGYYVLGSYHMLPQYALAASVERTVLPSASRPADPWYILGLTRYIRGDKAKVMLDGRVQTGVARPNYATAAQLQLYFR